MRKSYTFGIPFGLQRESGLFLDITEVSRGIDCNCICPACKTDLLAKQGEVKLWHFVLFYLVSIGVNIRQCFYVTDFKVLTMGVSSFNLL
ncbi:hypothetical protein KK057_22105, partial [Enterobacter mori]|nr:hypothetical protein [Enterobacter mori]